MSRRQVLELFYEQEERTRERVEYGVEHYRKGDFRLVLTDKDGKPSSGRSVKLTQKTHEFKYGANIFMLDQMESAEKNEAYKAYFAECFNMATLPFYWRHLEPQRGHRRFTENDPKIYRQPAIDLCMKFCREHGIEPREHAIAYERMFPSWLCDLSAEEIKRELESLMKEVGERYGDKLPTVEVTNEMDWDTGTTAFYEDPDYVEWCFKTARKYFPHNQLVINEYGPLPWRDKCRTTDKYYSYIEANLLKGAPIDAIGMQYHIFYPKDVEYQKTRLFYDPDNLFRHMDLYGRLGKPLQVTEITIPAYSNDPEDEEIQAELVRRLYEIWFSHPNMEQIIYWNLVDGYAHIKGYSNAEQSKMKGNMTVGENVYYGGLIRFDMTPKPSYYAVRDLFSKVWHTEAEAVTDRDGALLFRGFYGEYEIEEGGKKYTVNLSKKLPIQNGKRELMLKIEDGEKEE